MVLVMTTMMPQAFLSEDESAVLPLTDQQTCAIAVSIVPHTKLKRFRIFAVDTVAVLYQPEWIQAQLLPIDSETVWLKINQNAFRDALKLNRNHLLKSIKLDHSFELSKDFMAQAQLDTFCSIWTISHKEKITFDETYLYLKIVKSKV